MQRDEEPVVATLWSGCGVVLGDEPVHRVGQFDRERSALGSRREANLAVDAERGELLALRSGTGDEVPDLAYETSGDGEQPPRRALVRLPGRVRRQRRQRG